MQNTATSTGTRVLYIADALSPQGIPGTVIDHPAATGEMVYISYDNGGSALAETHEYKVI